MAFWSAAVSSVVPLPAAPYWTLTSTAASGGKRSRGLSGGTAGSGGGADGAGVGVTTCAGGWVFASLTVRTPTPAVQATARPPTKLKTVRKAVATVSDDGFLLVIRSLGEPAAGRPHSTQRSHPGGNRAGRSAALTRNIRK
jgi:hypothetical protein